MEIRPCPFISIVIPAYNRAHLIGETLDSIVSQSYTNWECIIVDDGSTDETENVVNGYVSNDSRIKFFKRERLPKGANSCRNIGFDRSTGEFIQFFDSDDIMDIKLLQTKVEVITSCPEVDLIICKHEIFPRDSLMSQIPVNIVSSDYLNDFVAERIKLNTQNTLIKRDVILKQGLFDESLARAQEVEFFSRILCYPCKIKTIERSLVKIRFHSDSITGSFYSHNISRIEADIFARLKIFKTLKNALNFEIKKYTLSHLQSVVATDLHVILKARDFKSYLKCLNETIYSGLFRNNFFKLYFFVFWSFAFMMTKRFQSKLYQSLNNIN